jgi:hypothetical protein
MVPVLAVLLLWVVVHGRRRTGAEGEPATAASGSGAASQGRGLRSAALVLAGFVLVVSPWLGFTWARYGSPMFDSVQADMWYQAYNVFETPDYDWGLPWRWGPEQARAHYEGDEPPRARVEADSPAERLREERSRGLAFAADHPGLVLRRLVSRTADLLTPNSFLVRHLRYGQYRLDATGRPVRPPPPRWLEDGLVHLASLTAMLLTALAWCGLLSMPRSPGRSLLTWTLLAFLLVHALSFAMSRYRLPLVPLMAVAAAALLARPVDGVLWLAAPRRRVVTVAGLVALAFLWGVHYRELWVRTIEP